MAVRRTAIKRSPPYGGRLIASLGRDTFRLFPLPCPSPAGRGSARQSLESRLTAGEVVAAPHRCPAPSNGRKKLARRCTAAYKEFASLMLSLDSYPLPLPHGRGERIAPASAPMRAQPARFARKRKQQKNSLRSFSALSFRQPPAAPEAGRYGEVR